MIKKQQHEELLILTKTYPHPSTKYRETTCVAAINSNREFRRVFPIPYRLLDGNYKFEKWEWIEAQLNKASQDHRPESYRIDVGSIRRIKKVTTARGWADRLQWIEPLIFDSFEALDIERTTIGNTLGIIRPSCLLGLDITPLNDKDKDWNAQEKANLLKEELFDSEEIKSRIPLRKIPYFFHYRYECETSQGWKKYRHMITDWEVGALYWNCLTSYGSQWELPFRQKLENEFSQKDLLFLLGTMHRFPHQWIIIGLIYPPKSSTIQTNLGFNF